MMMWRLIGLMLVLILAVGCGGGEVPETAVSDPTPTAIEQVEDAAVAEPTQLPTATLPPAALPTNVPAQDPVVPQPVDPDLEQEVTPALAVTDVPIVEPSGGETLGAGQRATASVLASEAVTYPFDGTRFGSLLFFAEPTAEVDLALRIYAGGEATGQPEAEIDFSGAGIPELGVFTPQADGAYLLEVVNLGEETAVIDTYAFTTTTATPLASVQQADSFGAGATSRYTVSSNGARPVLIYAAATDGANLIIDATDGAGNAVGTADFTGAGSSEALFLLPLRQTDYTFEIRAAGGEAASYELLIVPLE